MAKQNSSSGKSKPLSRVVLNKNVQVKPASSTPRSSVASPPSATVRSTAKE